MNRRYTIQEFQEMVARLRKVYEDVILTTDIIVGFPGESQEEFEKTYQFLQQIKFYKMHIFKYSPRKGTKAAQMKGQIDGKIKEERSKKLIALSNKHQKEYHEKYVGKEVEILFEEEKNGYYQGHTKNYILASAKSQKNLENKMIKAKCTEASMEAIFLEI